MICQKLSTNWDWKEDFSLSDQERQELISHLALCQECQTRQASQEKFRNSLKEMPSQVSLAQTELFVQKVMRQLPKPKSSLLLLWPLQIFPSAIGLALAVFAFFMFKQPETPTSPDALLLMDSQDKSLTELILPPDIENENNFLAQIMEGK